MNFTTTLLASALAVASAPVFAGAFTDLPTSGLLRVYGNNNPANDGLLLTPGAFDPISNTFALPANLTLLASTQTAFELPDEVDPTMFEEVGEFEDAVFRDTNDGKLVFASRIEMDLNEEGEINDIFRFGFDGYDVQVAWTPVTGADLRLYSAARSLVTNIESSEDPLIDEDVFDAGAVGLATDVNVEEGNAVTGWYFVKVLNDNVGFAIFQNAVGLNQAGEEGQAAYTAFLAGYAPTPVPVPAAVWLLGSAIAGMAGVARRRA